MKCPNKGPQKLSTADLAAIDARCWKSVKLFLQKLPPEKFKEIIVGSKLDIEVKLLPKELRLEYLVVNRFQRQHYEHRPLDIEDAEQGSGVVGRDYAKNAANHAKKFLTVSSGALPSTRPFGSYRCEWPNCGIRRASTKSLRVHMNIHLRTYKCSLCGACFQCARHLVDHAKSVHSSLRPFDCNDCGQTFKLAGNLLKHCRRKHSTETPPFQCPDCAKTTWALQALCDHRVRIHNWNWRQDCLHAS